VPLFVPARRGSWYHHRFDKPIWPDWLCRGPSHFLRWFKQVQKGPVLLELGGGDSCGLMANLFGLLARWSCHIDNLWLWGWVLRAFTQWRKLCLGFSLLFGILWLKRGCQGSVSCFSFTCWDARVLLIYGGAVPLNK